MSRIKQYLLKFLKFINKNTDKQLHFFYISFFTGIYTLLWPNPTQCFVIITSFMLMMGISIVKQIIDQKITGTKFNYKDILAGMMGWVISIFLIIIRISRYSKGINLFPCM